MMSLMMIDDDDDYDDDDYYDDDVGVDVYVDADVAIHGPVRPPIVSVLAHAAIGLMMMLLSS